MSNFNYLNPDNFKRWMRSQNDFETSLEKNLIGSIAETRFNARRLSKKIIIESGKVSKVSKEFVENGGTIKEIDGDECLIEVNSGSFYINKKYIII